jgi:ribonuclease HII
VLSADGFLMLYELVEAGGELRRDELEKRLNGRLITTFVQAWDNLIDEEYLEQLHEAYGLHDSIKLQQQQNLKLQQKLNEIKKQQQLHVAAFVQQATDPRFFSAPYQAVVNGKVARQTAMNTYLSKMSPIDRADFWQAYMDADDATQKSIEYRISRAAPRSR